MTVTTKLTLSKNRIALITGINLERRSVTFQEKMRMNAKIHSNQYLYYAIQPLIATIFLNQTFKNYLATEEVNVSHVNFDYELTVIMFK